MYTLLCWGFPGGTNGEELACNAGDRRDAGSVSGLGKSPGGGHGNPLQLFLPGESHGQRSLVGYSPRVAKSWTRLKQLSTHSPTTMFKIDN